MTTTTTNYGFLKYGSGETPWSHSSGLDAIDGELARPRIVANSPTVGATTTCDLSLARLFYFTVSQATSIAFSNVPAVGSPGFSTRIRLILTNGNAFTVTWPGSITWFEGVVPTLLTSGVDEIELVTRDGGTTWYGGHRSGKNFLLKGDVSSIVQQNSAGTVIVQTAASSGARAFSSRTGNSTGLSVPVGIPQSATDTGTTSSGAGSPVNLKSYATQADALNATGQGFRIRGWGTTANNVNAKTVRVAVGATQILSQTLQASVADHWEVTLTVFRTGATTADAIATGQTNGNSSDGVQFVAVSGLSDWSSTGNTIQFSCTQTSAADVVQEGLLVEWLGV